MVLQINRNGVICNKCQTREMNFYVHTGESVGHLNCSGCSHIFPITRKEYSQAKGECLELDFDTKKHIYVNEASTGEFAVK